MILLSVSSSYFPYPCVLVPLLFGGIPFSEQWAYFDTPLILNKMKTKFVLGMSQHYFPPTSSIYISYPY